MECHHMTKFNCRRISHLIRCVPALHAPRLYSRPSKNHNTAPNTLFLSWQTEDSRLAVCLAQKRVKRLRAEICSQTMTLEAVKGRHGGKGNCRALQQLQLEKRSAQDDLREEKLRKAAAASCLRAAFLAQHETEAAAASSRRADYRSGTRQQRGEKAYDQIAPPRESNSPSPPGRLRLGCTAPAAGQSVWVGEPHWSPHLFAAQPKHGRHIHVPFRKESIHPQGSYTRK